MLSSSNTPSASLKTTMFNRYAPTILLASMLLSQINSSHAAQNSAVAVMYHRIGENSYPTTNIRIDQFEAQLQFLQQNNFQVWPLAKIIEQLRHGKPLPDKTIALTMDDAYLSVYTQAYPRLKKLRWPFTVFVTTDYIDKKLPNFMSWEQMREMEKHGASFGNHSSRHDYMPRRLKGEDEAQWQQRMVADIRHAQKRLEQELPQVEKLFVYPYGEYNLALANIVAAEGLTGIGQQSGAMGPTSDFRYLPRFPVNEHYGSIADFGSKVMSLAMPLARDPGAESATTNKRPSLTFTFDKQHPRLRQFSCYFNNQPMKLDWLNDFEVKVQPQQDLPVGRSRYNCTAPSGEKGRFYWYSQQWVRPGGGGGE